MEHTYKLKYQLDSQRGEFKKTDFKDGDGGCDHLLMASIIHPEDGSYSMQFNFIPGTTEFDDPKIEDIEVWKAAMMMIIKTSGRMEKSDPRALVGYIATLASEYFIFGQPESLDELIEFLAEVKKID